MRSNAIFACRSNQLVKATEVSEDAATSLSRDFKDGANLTAENGGYIKDGQYHFFLQYHLGSNRVVARADGTVVQTNHYYPYGTPFAESYSSDIQKYKYIGKEYDTDNGLDWYDVEARMMDGLRFTTMDPLAEKYYSISPYAYGMGNPMKFVDRNGLYPESILQYDPNLGLYEGYRFTALAAQLLSFVSGVSRVYIDNAIVQERKPGQYRPLYPANKSGGAITIGHSIGVTITYTENWFDDDPSSYNGHGYGQNIYAWLSLSAHEIGHIPQIGKLGGIMGYLYEFVKQYAKYGHDAAPLEKEAEKGRTEFKEFYKFANTTYGQNSIESLFNSKDTEGQKMYTLNSWWNSYQEYMNKKTVSFIGNFQNLQLGVYTWNGVDWTP